MLACTLATHTRRANSLAHVSAHARYERVHTLIDGSTRACRPAGGLLRCSAPSSSQTLAYVLARFARTRALAPSLKRALAFAHLLWR
eukprot:6180407-Pleurochrysis_carterae.AAC.1